MWHTKPLENIINELKTDAHKGLSATEARKRFEEYGANQLPTGKRTTWVNFLLRQFQSPLVYILLIGATLSAYPLQAYVDMSVILLAVFVNVSVGFWQEFRSSNILEKLKAIVEIRALALRDGEVHEIDAAELVPGDIIVLKAGRKIPADARILSARHLEIDEALLTGESAPVAKRDTLIKERDVAVGDRTNMVHMGTVISRGEGAAVVVQTGSTTEIGKIALLTAQTREEKTPLQLRIGRLGNKLALIIGAASVVIFFYGLYNGHPFQQMFTTAIAVAVAAIPEGLPAAISIVLAVSAQRILKRKGVVKHLVAAETLGSASVICADKTGTLTQGKMVVEKLYTGNDDEVHAREILALANEALVEKTREGNIVRGETTDSAKMHAFLDAGGDYDALQKKYPRVDILQFNPSRKYIASLHRLSPEYPANKNELNSNSDSGSFGNHSSDIRLFITGAPEVLLSLSGHIVSSSGKEQLFKERVGELEQVYRVLAGEGYRIIAMAERTLPWQLLDDNHNPVKESGDSNGAGNNPPSHKATEGQGDNTKEEIDLENEEVREKVICDLTFVGFAAIRDPIREDVRDSIRTAREAGVRPIMLTGDHVLTARAIGGELGFRATQDAVVEGHEIETISDIDLERRLRTVEVFARVNPEHKMRIVDLLQREGEVVAMTGDGVNDAPALKSADIGVALGSGTDVAKEASDLILLNNSFTIIVSAIRQGRIAFDNIRKVTVFLLVQSFTELMLIMAALLLRLPLPLTAVQILWTNLIEDSFPNVALSFEPGEKDIMKRKPVGKGEPILDAESKVIVFVVGLLTDAVLLGLFLFLYFYSHFSLEHIRTFVFAALGLDSFFYIYSIKSLRRPIFSYNIFNNPYLTGASVLGIGAMLAAVYVPFLNGILGTIPLAAIDWVVVVGLGILKIIGIEFTKWWFVWRR